MQTETSPAAILQLGMAFSGSKTLLSAVELELFTVLADGPQTGGELEQRLGLHPRATFDFLDALVALEMLDRAGDGPDATYRNSHAAARFLDRRSPEYVGGLLEMANSRLYPFWADLTSALKTGQPQNEIKHTGKSMFEGLYADPARLEQFMDAMRGGSRGNFQAFARKFDFSPYRTMADIGGATGELCSIVATAQPHMTCRSFDLPVVLPIAERRIRESGCSRQVTAHTIDFFEDDFPAADLITMGMILHDWNLEQKRMLIGKAYAALPQGGALVAIENLIDDSRRENAFGLLMSLNMLIEFGDAFDFTGADFAGWCTEAGFNRCEVLPLGGPASAAIAYK
jgi:O-methyltransferase domain/Dimerisation domain